MQIILTEEEYNNLKKSSEEAKRIAVAEANAMLAEHKNKFSATLGKLFLDSGVTPPNTYYDDSRMRAIFDLIKKAMRECKIDFPV